MGRTCSTRPQGKRARQPPRSTAGARAERASCAGQMTWSGIRGDYGLGLGFEFGLGLGSGLGLGLGLGFR